MERREQYIAIDLKSFYASAECVLRGLDPLTTNLVVADESRTEKTICLAVSPSLKAYGIPGRARLFEVIEKVSQVNALRRRAGEEKKSWDAEVLAREPNTLVDYIVAKPQMAWYLQFSAKIYKIYLQFVAPEDIHVYSIDEVFIYATPYLRPGKLDAEGFARQIMKRILDETGITATAGIGTNLYLCKIAMDIVAKHAAPDENGARMAVLDEITYREKLWTHTPITDFWRVGRGTAKRLEKVGIRTMGDIARCSLGADGEYYNENLLYKLFGINAELLIDHAWGYEPCRMEHIKAYRPENNSISSGQVLTEPYPFEKARMVALEMAEGIALELTERGTVTNQITVVIGYDRENMKDETRFSGYTGEIVRDHYGRAVPKYSHATQRLSPATASGKTIRRTVGALFDSCGSPAFLIRRLTLSCSVLPPEEAGEVQLNLFEEPPKQDDRREVQQQKAILEIKKRFGKNAILRGTSFQDGATARERNGQIGGHRA